MKKFGCIQSHSSSLYGRQRRAWSHGPQILFTNFLLDIHKMCKSFISAASFLDFMPKKRILDHSALFNSSFFIGTAYQATRKKVQHLIVIVNTTKIINRMEKLYS